MRDIFFHNLNLNAQKNKNIILLVADIGFGVVDEFKKNNPNQFFNIGISEQNMAGIATGLALSGKKVFCYSIGNFTSLRSLEFIRNGACYHNLDVNFISGGSGYSYGSLGYSHHAIEDLSIMRSLPNMTVYSPSSFYEAEYLSNYLSKNKKKISPSYIRLDKSKIENLETEEVIKNISIPRYLVKSEKSQILIFSTGGILSHVKVAANLAKKKGIHCDICSVFNLSQINKKFKKDLKINKFLVVEETIKENGLYSLIRDEFQHKKIDNISIDKNNIFFKAGTQDYIRKKQKISSQYILKKIIKLSKI